MTEFFTAEFGKKFLLNYGFYGSNVCVWWFSDHSLKLEVLNACFL